MTFEARHQAAARQRAAEQLEEARDAYEAFTIAMHRLGQEVRETGPGGYFLYERVDAYPGWNGSRDVGAGKSMTGWLDEIAEFLDDPGNFDA